jgi:ribosomal protein S18 acetylase RimI-like enzyme
VTARLRELYAAFNERDIDRVLRALTADVDWPNAWEGGRVIGHDAVRDYWTRQWAAIAPTVEPLAFGRRADGTIAVTVRQTVRDLEGAVLSEGLVVHAYTPRGEQFARMDVESAGVIDVREHSGPRTELRYLFELAEDSSQQLDAYIDAGRVLVATDGDKVVGHLQITETGRPDEAEIKNMAVDPAHQGRGVGRALVQAAIALARDESRSTLVVATVTADIGNLRFYQRLGFRMRSIERDAFTRATGYEQGLEVGGIELRDRVWLDLRLDA